MVKKSVIFGTVAVVALAIILGVTLTVTRKDDDDPKKVEDNPTTIEDNQKTVNDNPMKEQESNGVETDATPPDESNGVTVANESYSDGSTAAPIVAKSMAPSMVVSSSPTPGPTGTLVWNDVGGEIYGGPLMNDFSPLVEITNGGKQVWMAGLGSLMMHEFDSNKGSWYVRQDLSDDMSGGIYSMGATSDGKSIIVGQPSQSMAMVFTNDDLDNVNSTWALRGSPIKQQHGQCELR